MTVTLINARILTPHGFRSDLAVVIENGAIRELLPADQARTTDAVLYDLCGMSLVPGFIDCQVNGGGGVLFNNAPNVDALRRIGDTHRRFGTTSFLPTLISDDAQVMRAAIDATRQAIAEKVPGVLGIHLEGPYLAPSRKGTHDDRKFRIPDAAEIELATSLENGISLITLAPERVPIATINALIARGAILAAGHSAASYEQVRAALNAGVRGFTHLYNAMSPLQGREPGMVGAALEDRNTWCGIIVDGHHVHAASLRIALAAKPRGKVFLVTDAMPPVGADSPSYELYGETITARDGVCRNAAGALAGSALDMASAVRNAVSMLGVTLDEAARMASTYPAEFLGIADRYGQIAPGYRADLVVLDANIEVRGTWVGGTASPELSGALRN